MYISKHSIVSLDKFDKLQAIAVRCTLRFIELR